jgi:Ni/Co efflux regulator RcnB
MKKLILATVCAVSLSALGTSVASAQMAGPQRMDRMERMDRVDSNARMMHRHHMKRHKMRHMHGRTMRHKRYMGM